MRYSLLFAGLVMFGFATLALAGTPPDGNSAAAVLQKSPRHGEWVDIKLPDDVKLKSWVVYPERSDKAPVVIVIHEIYGLTDWVRGVADQLAAEGFIAIAPDMLSGKGPNGGGTDSLTGNEVGKTIRALTADECTVRLNAVRDYGMSLPSASGKTATIGFCWGGATSFAFAARQPKLDLALVYYGTGPEKPELAKIACPVVGFYGKDDARVTSTVEPTQASMKELSKSYSATVYDGAGHGFLRQQTGREGKNQAAADAAWIETVAQIRKLEPAQK